MAASLQSLSGQVVAATANVQTMTAGQQTLSVNMGTLATAMTQQIGTQGQIAENVRALQQQLTDVVGELKHVKQLVTDMTKQLTTLQLHSHNVAAAQEEASTATAAIAATAATAATAAAAARGLALRAAAPPTTTTAAAGALAADLAAATAPAPAMPAAAPLAAATAVAPKDPVSLAPLPVQATASPTPATQRLLSVPTSSKADTANTVKGQLASDLFVTAWTKHGGQLPPGMSIGDRRRAMLCFETLMSLVTPAEREALRKGGNPGEAKRLAERLNDIAVAWFRELHTARKMAIPTKLKSKCVLKVGSFETRYTELKIKDHDREKLLGTHAPNFRKDHDSNSKRRSSEASNEGPHAKKACSTHVAHARPQSQMPALHGSGDHEQGASVPQAQQQQMQGANAAMPSGAVTSFGDCSHATEHCKATNTPCSQCSLLVCSECALVISGGDVAKGYVCPAHLQDRTCAYRLGTCMATLHKCKEPGCGRPVCSVCAARISFDYPPNGYWCQTHANTLSTTSNII